MRRPLVYFYSALTICALLLTLFLTYTTPTANAVEQPDPCVKCQAKVQKRLEQCEAKSGGPTLECYDEFNLGIVECYATVCEQ
jgi:hypothetical protein